MRPVIRVFLMALLACLAPGPSHASAPSLDAARLFDWYYPGERAYLSLKAAAQKAGRTGWLTERMGKGELIPQASARELALDLIEDPSLDDVSKQELALAFKAEAGAFRLDDPSLEPRVAGLEEAFTRLNKKMEELEESVKANQYNKQSYPGTSVSVRGAYVNTGGADLLKGANAGYYGGRVFVRFDGQNSTGGFGFAMSQNFGRSGDAPVSTPGRGLEWTAPSFEFGYKAAMFSASWGGAYTLKRSALVLGSPAGAGVPKNFFVDLAEGETLRPTPAELSLGLPYGGWWVPHIIYLHKQGREDYWPFQDFEVFYGPEPQFVETWNTDKTLIYGATASTELGSMGGLLDRTLFYGAIFGAVNDKDLLRSYGLVGNPASEFDWALGSDLALPWGGQWVSEYGQTSLEQHQVFLLPNPALIYGYNGGTINNFERRFKDEGWVTAYMQPIGIFTFGLEYSHIGSLFRPSAGAVANWVLDGVNYNVANYPSVMSPWSAPPQPTGHFEHGKAIVDTTSDLAWGTDVSTATSLMGNTDKWVLQSQASWSWISLGLFNGIAQQIRASGPWIRTSPHIESGEAGRLFYDAFGEKYYHPPNPGAAAPPQAAPGLYASYDYYQWAYNQPADGTAKGRTGSNFGAHWNAIAQYSYRKLDYYLLLSRDGVRDNRVDLDSVKFINYMAGTLKLDFQSLIGRLLPFDFQFYGETRDVASTAGMIRFGEPGDPSSPDKLYFTQSYSSANARYGLTKELTFSGLVSYEEWKSNHSFYQMFVRVLEYGVGLDIDAAKMLSGLGLFTRARIAYLDDMFIGKRALNAWDVTVGSSLDF